MFLNVDYLLDVRSIYVRSRGRCDVTMSNGMIVQDSQPAQTHPDSQQCQLICKIVSNQKWTMFALLGIVLLGVLLLGIWVFNLRRDLLGNFYSLLLEDPLLQSWFGDNILLLDGA